MSEFIKKEQQIINKLKETNFEIFDNNADDAYLFLDQALESMPKYVNIVIAEQRTTPIIYAKYDGEDARQKIQELDQRRRITHNACISHLKSLNRLCTKLGLEPYADINMDDRYAVANFAGTYVSQTFLDGTHTTLDEVALTAKKDYDITAIRSRLADEILEPITHNTEKEPEP